MATHRGCRYEPGLVAGRALHQLAQFELIPRTPTVAAHLVHLLRLHGAQFFFTHLNSQVRFLAAPLRARRWCARWVLGRALRLDVRSRPSTDLAQVTEDCSSFTHDQIPACCACCARDGCVSTASVCFAADRHIVIMLKIS